MNTSSIIQGQLQAPSRQPTPAHLTPDLIDRLAAKHNIGAAPNYGTIRIMGESQWYDLREITMALAWEILGGAEIGANDSKT